LRNYLNLLSEILEEGTDYDDRTGVGSKSIFGSTMRWDLSKGFPIITTRKVPFRFAFEETMLFLRGQTDTKILEEKNINIWQGNTSREFLDSRGLFDLEDGSLGLGYSHQWRNFGGELNIEGSGVDQIKNLLNGLKNNPNDRRHIVTAWNPTQLSGTPLPPCHLMNMYAVENGKLNSCWIQRSCDTVYGIPMNIMCYAFLNIAFSKILGLEPGKLVFFGWNVHIYNNQISIASDQITRKPFSLPTLNIAKDLTCLEDLLLLQYEDIKIENYISHPDYPNKPKMAT